MTRAYRCAVWIALGWLLAAAMPVHGQGAQTPDAPAAPPASAAPKDHADAPQATPTPVPPDGARAAERKGEARAQRSERRKVRVRSTVSVIDPSADVRDIIRELRARRADQGAGERQGGGGGARPAGEGRDRGARGGAGHGGSREPKADAAHTRDEPLRREAASEARHERREARSMRGERRRGASSERPGEPLRRTSGGAPR